MLNETASAQGSPAQVAGDTASSNVRALPVGGGGDGGEGAPRAFLVRAVAASFKGAAERGQCFAERAVMASGEAMGHAIRVAFPERDRRLFAGLFCGALRSAAGVR